MSSPENNNDGNWRRGRPQNKNRNYYQRSWYRRKNNNVKNYFPKKQQPPEQPMIVWRKVDHLSEIFQKLSKDIVNKDALVKASEVPSAVTKAVFSCDKSRPVDEITNEITTIDELIELSVLFEDENFKNRNYSINVEAINKMKPALQELQAMVGLDNIKQLVIEHIMFFSQELHTVDGIDKSVLASDCSSDMFHTVIYGKPGVGKTAFAKILAKIYLSLGVTKKDVFVVAKRTDLVGEYLGHTAMKTQKKIDEAMGGVLFIDEAYSLGSSTENKVYDSYSKECIDTLTYNLTENKGKFVCIIAGYKEEIEKNLFSVNPGLKRRFTFSYNIEGYSEKELLLILLMKIKKIQWRISEECEKQLTKRNFFEGKMESFPHYAGDVETLLLNIKISHSRRTFGKSYTYQKVITMEDLEAGYKRYLKNRPTPKKEYTNLTMYS
jgi:SpoVK/Ycf46/Vps4 family AAA+-type ATPase